MWKNKTIRIVQLADVSLFVQEASKLEQDVIVSRGKFAVDGKSLMGVLSIDVSQSVVVTYWSENEDFDKFLARFEA